MRRKGRSCLDEFWVGHWSVCYAFLVEDYLTLIHRACLLPLLCIVHVRSVFTANMNPLLLYWPTWAVYYLRDL
jgi:hypothetical protein